MTYRINQKHYQAFQCSIKNAAIAVIILKLQQKLLNTFEIPVNYSSQKGIVAAPEYDISDIILIFIMIIMSFTMVREEKDN